MKTELVPTPRYPVPESVDVVVVGAGLTGAASTWALSRSGYSVVLFEAHDFGHDKGSSHGSSRIFRHIYPDALYVRMAIRATEAWRRIESDSGLALLRTTGGIEHGSRRDPKVLATILSKHDVRHELLSPDDAAKRWPEIIFRGPVLYTPESGVINADQSITAFLDVAGRHGAHLVSRTPVEAIEVQGNRAVVHAGDSVRARRVVLALGPWLPELCAKLAPHVSLPPLQVTQQQVFHFTQRNPNSSWPTLLHSDYRIFGLPSGADGGPWPAVKVSEHEGGIATTARSRSGTIDSNGQRRVIEYVREWLPGLNPDPVADGTCLYTMTPDEDFVLDHDGPLVVASPCSGHGAKFAPLLGETIRDLVLGRDKPHPRFALRRRVRPVTSRFAG